MLSGMIRIFSLLFAGTCLSCTCYAAKKPNFILAMADDQGWGEMGYQGHKVLKTPNFDDMSKSGLRFDRFYAAAPVCSPTRASCLTGRHPNRMGVFKWGYPMRTGEITIAEALKKAGYATAHFGKWHLGSVRADSAACPGANGFDEWASAPNFYENNPLFSHNGKVIEVKGESSLATMEIALQWIRKMAEADKPFLAVIWFGSPHGPHIGVDKFLAPYAKEAKAMQNFYAEITGMDAAMGELRKGLRDINKHEETLLWYTSDNGGLKPNSMGGLSGKKGNLLEGGIRVPAILEWPAKIPEPRTSSAPCNTSDFYPTLLELAGVSLPKGQPPLDGISLVPLIEGKTDIRKKAMGFWDFPAPGRSRRARAMLEALRKEQQAGEQKPAPKEGHVEKQYSTKSFPGPAAWIDGDWKLLRGKGTPKLFNLTNDFAEKNDIAGKHPEKVAEMQKALLTWQQSVTRSLNGEDYKK
jgi:arylsulfatase A-like enzyme